MGETPGYFIDLGLQIDKLLKELDGKKETCKYEEDIILFKTVVDREIPEMKTEIKELREHVAPIPAMANDITAIKKKVFNGYGDDKTITKTQFYIWMIISTGTLSGAIIFILSTIL